MIFLADFDVLAERVVGEESDHRVIVHNLVGLRKEHFRHGRVGNLCNVRDCGILCLFLKIGMCENVDLSC